MVVAIDMCSHTARPAPMMVTSLGAVPIFVFSDKLGNTNVRSQRFRSTGFVMYSVGVRSRQANDNMQVWSLARQDPFMRPPSRPPLLQNKALKQAPKASLRLSN